MNVFFFAIYAFIIANCLKAAYGLYRKRLLADIQKWSDDFVIAENDDDLSDKKEWDHFFVKHPYFWCTETADSKPLSKCIRDISLPHVKLIARALLARLYYIDKIGAQLLSLKTSKITVGPQTSPMEFEQNIRVHLSRLTNFYKPCTKEKCEQNLAVLGKFLLKLYFQVVIFRHGDIVDLDSLYFCDFISKLLSKRFKTPIRASLHPFIVKHPLREMVESTILHIVNGFLRLSIFFWVCIVIVLSFSGESRRK